MWELHAVIGGSVSIECVKSRETSAKKKPDTAFSYVVLHLLQADPLGFRVEREHDKKLRNHHRREDYKWYGARTGGHNGKNRGNHRIHEPMGKASQTLSSGTNKVREHLAQVDPDDG